MTRDLIRSSRNLRKAKRGWLIDQTTHHYADDRFSAASHASFLASSYAGLNWSLAAVVGSWCVARRRSPQRSYTCPLTTRPPNSCSLSSSPEPPKPFRSGQCGSPSAIVAIGSCIPALLRPLPSTSVVAIPRLAGGTAESADQSDKSQSQSALFAVRTRSSASSSPPL